MSAPPSPPTPPANNAPRGRVVPRPRPQIQVSSYQFPGQLPGEQVVWVKRQSRWFFLATAWPIILGVLLLIFLVSTQGFADGLPRLIELFVFVATALYTLRWLFTDLLSWYVNIYILTNQRVLGFKGYFNRQSEEVVLRSVRQVYVVRPNPLQVALRIGNLEVRPIGPALEIKGISNPRAVADSILAVQANPPGSGGPAVPTPKVASPRIQATLDTLAQPEPMPLPVPVTRRPFYILFQRPVPINFIEGESIVEIVYRHWFVLLRRELPAILIAVGSVVLSFLLRGVPTAGTTRILLLAGGIGISLFIAALLYLNYADDIFVLTTHRVIDIDRLFYVLADYSNDAPYAAVQDVRVERPFFGKVFGYGHIHIDTSGRKNPVHMKNVPHAFALMDRIFAQIHGSTERANVAIVNKQKKENHRWIATVLNDLVVEVPDVRGMPLLVASARVRGAGLKLVVDVERPVAGAPPGRVVQQTPAPGATELADNEVRVVLSARNVPATP